MSDLMLDVGLANELKMAFRRHDYTGEEIKRLAKGDFLGQVRNVLLGLMEIRPRTFPVWKTVKLGLRKSADEYRKAIEASGNRFSDWASDIIGRPEFKTAAEECEVDLVVASNAELGFPQGATVKQTFDRAKELGLELCPNEIGPALLEHYQDQPVGEWFLIAMEPIAGSDGRLHVFRVGRDELALWLYARGGRPGSFWFGHCRWVFVRPCK